MKTTKEIIVNCDKSKVFFYDENGDWSKEADKLFNKKWFSEEEIKQAFKLGLNNGSQKNFEELIK